MTRTNTYALSEFLLARIAEDEVVARDFDSEEVDNPPIERQRWVRARNEWVTLYDPARALAECEAKREIVDLYDPNDYADDGGIGSSWVMKQALEALAVVYSDHPDYREKW